MTTYTNPLTGTQLVALRLTPDTLHEVAEWTGGRIRGKDNGEQFVHVSGNNRALAVRMGEWVGHRPDSRTWLMYPDWAFQLLYAPSRDGEPAPSPGHRY